MALSEREFEDLTTLIYASVLDGESFVSFLKRLSEVAGGIHTHFCGYDLEANVNLGAVAFGYAPEFVNSYHQYYGSKNAWSEGVLRGQVGIPHVADWLCPREKLIQTEYYNDWIVPQEDIIGGGSVVLFRDEGRVIRLGGNIRRKDKDKLEEKWMKILKRLTPHVQQAFEIMRTISSLSLQREFAIEARSEVAASWLAMTEEGYVVCCSNSARALLDEGSFFRRSHNNRMSFTYWSHQNEFEKRLLTVANSAGHGPQTFLMEVDNGRRKVVCRVARLALEKLPYPYLANTLLGARDLFLVTISTSQANEYSVPSQLVERFGLSSAEVKTILKLVQGLTPREIAEERQVSIHTVRDQIKAAMSKLGVRRQIEIGSLVESLRH